MMGKFYGTLVLFGLLTIMVAYTQGLKCHECKPEEAGCKNVEAGKQSNFSKDCSPSNNKGAVDACKLSGKETSLEKACSTMIAERGEKVGCEDMKDGMKLCFCTSDNCNGKESTAVKGGAAVFWNNPPQNYYSIFIFWIICTTLATIYTHIY